MFKKFGLIILSILILVSSTATAGTETKTTLFYYEDFAGYAAGTLPSGWTIVENGAGDSAQRVAVVSGNNVLLALSQTGKSAVLKHALSSVPDTIIFSFDASIPDGGSVTIGNGTLKATVSGYATGQWAKYSLEIDFANGVYNLTVNGTLKKSGEALSASSAGAGIVLDTGHTTGNDTAMIDNLLVLEVTEVEYIYYSHNTVCSFGPHFRDVTPALTDKWYMFTPVDLSQDGTQTYILVGGGAYIIGQVNIFVSGDNVTVTYQYFNDDIWDEKQFFTLFPDYASITTVNPEEIVSPFAYGQPISIANDLNGDTKVLLFTCNVVTFRNDNPEIIRFWENITEYKTQREQMLTLLDGAQGY